MPERGHKHSPRSGTSARTGTSAEMGVEVVQRSLSSSGTGRPVPERGASHDTVLELGEIFGPSSGTGTVKYPSSGTRTVSDLSLTYMPSLNEDVNGIHIH